MTVSTENSIDTTERWLDRPLLGSITINWEIVLFAGIVLIALFTRFYDLESRVMSHDESLHTYYSWRLYRGFGFQHSPLMHGPWQFITIALTYFLFGDSDWSARIPAVLTSILTVAFIWQYRRYLGKIGALIAAALLTISPFMLYYGRYVRNEAYVGLFGVIMLWAMLRYLDTGRERYLYYLTAATALHFTAKETAFIYTAQALLFLGLVFVRQVTRKNWAVPGRKRAFLIALIVSVVMVGLAGSALFLAGGAESLSATEVAEPLDPTAEATETPGALPIGLPVTLAAIGLLAFGVALFFLILGFSWQRLRNERAFALLVLLWTMVLPQLSPFAVRAIGADPLDYTPQGMFRTGIVLIPFVLGAIALGLFWNSRQWLINAAIFYAIFGVFYTTVFTNGQGFFTGLVGSLGYWLEQQGVRRGSQPWYYYLFVQIPIYEYLAFLGSLLAVAIGGRRWLTATAKGRRKDQPSTGENGDPASMEVSQPDPPAADENLGRQVAVPLLGFWVLTSIFAYTSAGEKMPWLTYHIALPMILLSGWALGEIANGVDWGAFRNRRGWAAIGLFLIFIPSLFAAVTSWLGTSPPFQGQELSQLQATSTFLTAVVAAVISAWGLFLILKSWDLGQIGRIGLLVTFVLMGLLTARASFIAAYVNYDNATEFLVYAHAAGPVKQVIEQTEEISRRTAGDLSMVVAYDDDVSWPFTWYLRNYQNQRYYGSNPTRDLRDVPIIIVGDNNFGKIEPVVGQAYYQFDYIRMWWPDQDYFNMTLDRLWAALRDPQMRAAIFNIWLNRDFGLYSEIKGRDNLTLANWSPSDRMRMYVRKDVAASLWNYGVAASPADIIADPYEGKEAEIAADFFFGQEGNQPGQLLHPRGLAFAADGTFYVADSDNHRIQRFDQQGQLLTYWGTFADIAQGEAPQGSFNQPWDVAVGPDGSVYVADTWNHRIQKFSAAGDFITMWGFFGQAETPEAFWGPRSLVVDANGLVYVSDTGNKRVVVFDENGVFLSQFGEIGFSPGQFDEPVGLAIDGQERLYVADAWNQRVQRFSPAGDSPGGYVFGQMWDIFGWFGQSLENKPYLDVDLRSERLFVADPEGYRIIEFTLDGEPVRYWGDFSTGPDGLGLASGVAVAPDGAVWVSDGANNRILRYVP